MTYERDNIPYEYLISFHFLICVNKNLTGPIFDFLIF